MITAIVNFRLPADIDAKKAAEFNQTMQTVGPP